MISTKLFGWAMIFVLAIGLLGCLIYSSTLLVIAFGGFIGGAICTSLAYFIYDRSE